jgi:hypothetical protein
MEAIASAQFVPSITNRGQIKSSVLMLFSATRRRENAFILLRRIRVAGYSPLLMPSPLGYSRGVLLPVK